MDGQGERRALVVDDSKVMRLLLAKVLTQAGFTAIDHAGDGSAGLAALAERPDTAVALVDWNMPTMTGIEMVEAVRADERLSRVRLVMVTTESEAAHVERAMAAGVHGYVVKPFTTEAILDALRRAGL